MYDLEIIKNTVSTAPCYNGGASFKTHSLSKTSNGFAFKPSINGLAFALVFALTGLGIFSFGIYKIIIGTTTSEYLFLLLFGAVFLAAGIFILLLFLRPRVFNKNSNYYYKGFRKNVNRENKNYVSLNRIIALQLIGETISSDNGSYKSFELNLVLDDATRLNVVDHGNLKKLIIDTEILSNFLNVPIWHAESNKREKQDARCNYK